MFKLFRNQPQQEEQDDIDLYDTDYKDNSFDDYTNCCMSILL